MPFTLEKNCQPESFEEDIYLEWEKAGNFKPEKSTSSKTYCNILPPPNANGELHLGHASGYTLMDLFGRYHRMLGKKTLLLPGKDHAGIQSQVVYEKKIKTERNITRQDLGREKFYQEIYDFCQDRMVYMRKQEKKMGLSADWSREKFTLNPEIVKTVLETFIKMYNEIDKDGNRMVYKGERIINWCPRCGSALSDFEVEHKKQNTQFYTFKYSSAFPIAISTTRPETKLGDTAVAVNPKDKRYKKYIGKIFETDFLGIPLKIKIITDPQIEMDFGTGALGVTPAHSIIDWEIAQKNNLPIIKVIDEKANILPNFQNFSGLSALQARKEIIKLLKENQLLEKEETLKNNLSVCERCKSAIEPLPSKQWFVNVDHPNFSLKKEARKVIEKEQIKIYPARFKKIMLSWIDNVHDWCISRQIWWGPRIPAWYKNDEIKVQIESPGKNWLQDEDTFDTWFSSGQWVFTTLGYPQNQDFKDFYPSDNMIMGRDILPLWAFRMIILSLYRTKKIPFKNLYFTGLVRDEKGQKMSKSKGNGIEPLEIIKKYGTDAVRLSLIIGSSPGNDINLSEAKIAGQRNLINKFWNIARFILSKIAEEKNISQKLPCQNLTSADFWILEKMQNLIQTTTSDLENYRFSLAGEKLRDFTWNDLADWYLEVCKFENNQTEKKQILNIILKDLLKLWHPFIPFVTEKIWQQTNESESLMLAAWPKEKNYSQKKPPSSNFKIIQNIVSAIRNFKSEYNIAPGKKIGITLISKEFSTFLKEQQTIISSLKTGANIKKISSQKIQEKNSLSIFLEKVEILISLNNLINIPAEIQRLKKEIREETFLLENLKKRLKNKNFTEKAPLEIFKKEQKRAQRYQEKIEKNKNYLQNLEKNL